MSRLTKLDNDITKVKGTYMPYDERPIVTLSNALYVQCLLNKLGQLEDLLQSYNVKDLKELDKLLGMATTYEELSKQLGCPLDLVLVPYSLSGLKKIWYHKQWCDVVRVVAYEEATRPYMEVRCKDYKYLKTIFLDDYKNTWWLKEDKSE